MRVMRSRDLEFATMRNTTSEGETERERQKDSDRQRCSNGHMKQKVQDSTYLNFHPQGQVVVYSSGTQSSRD